MKKLSIVVGSILGALAVHGALMACGSSATSAMGGAVPNASAEGAGAPACKNWKVSSFFASEFMNRPDTSDGWGEFKDGLAKEIALPPGWEPLGITPWPVGNGQNYGGIVTVRACVD